MITVAITAGIVALLSALGVDPTPYVAPLAIAVKILVVTPLVAGTLWWKKRRDAKEQQSAAAARAAPGQP